LHARRDLRQGAAELLTRLVVPILVAAATPEQLYEGRQFLDEDHWRAAWARLASADRIALLERFQKSVDAAFVPGNATEAEALWRFVLRTGDIDGPLDAMLASPSGVEILQRHLATGTTGEFTEPVRTAYAKAFALDEATLAPPRGDDVLALLARFARLGFAGTWLPEDVAKVRRARLLRGV
jgi:hypothetical protein